MFLQMRSGFFSDCVKRLPLAQLSVQEDKELVVEKVPRLVTGPYFCTLARIAFAPRDLIAQSIEQ
jgi:hypothetical protein